MQKKLMSTVLLFLIGIGFGWFALYQLFSVHDIGLGLLYLLPTFGAFGALIMLPFRAMP